MKNFKKVLFTTFFYKEMCCFKCSYFKYNLDLKKCLKIFIFKKVLFYYFLKKILIFAKYVYSQMINKKKTKFFRNLRKIKKSI